MAGPLLDLRGQELHCSFPSEPLLLEADRTRLLQIIVNLLNNAASYSEPGGQVWLTLEREAAQAAVRVRDQGVGIDPTLLPTLFDLFVQGDASGHRNQVGLGVGLHLVKRLVELHGGTITAASGGLGEGAEFVARLPLADTLRA